MWRVLGCMVALAGCGGDAVERVEQGEVCGAAGPFRVLELDPDQRMFGAPLRVGDRVIYDIGRYDLDNVTEYGPTLVEEQLWASGPCGEAPVELAGGVEDPFVIDRWPDVLLACDPLTHDVVSVDPTGVAKPHPVFLGVASLSGCPYLRWTDAGLVTVAAFDPDLGDLMIHRYPDDPRTQTATPELLLSPIRTQTRGGFVGEAMIRRQTLIRTLDDAALVVTAEDELVRVALADGAVTPVQPDVFAFAVDASGRYVVWQDPVVTGGEPEYPEGALFLRDLADGADAVFLGQGSLIRQIPPLRFIADGLVQVEQRIFRMATQELVDLPEGTYLLDVIDERSWYLIGGTEGDGNFRFEPVTGAATSLFPTPAQPLEPQADGALLLQVPHYRVQGHQYDEGPLWFAPYDGAAPRRLAARATQFGYPLADGRRVTWVDLDDVGKGALVVIDTETEEELRVDDDAYIHGGTLQMFADGVIVYSVADGDRSGVWLARPLPAR